VFTLAGGCLGPRWLVAPEVAGQTEWREAMAEPTMRAAESCQTETVSRDLLAQMDEAAAGWEH
jgi:hypothetical protein